jgi:nickel/cobalt exporter
MKRLALLVVLAAALLAPASATAHPLGNFTVNRFAAVEATGGRIYVEYVLDLAEIPTFQARGERARPGYADRLAEQIGRGLELTVAGRRVPLTPVARTIAFPDGQGGLATTRFEALYQAPAGPNGVATALVLEDTNFAGRTGWREIVVRAGEGARLLSSSAPATSVSDELRAYPEDLLQSPLDRDRVAARLVPGEGPGVAPALAGGREEQERPHGGFAALVSEDDLSAGFVALSLVLALFWGAAHAFSPGHGKAIVAGYLVGTRGTARHALQLGAIVTVTHTIGVFALGLVTLALSEFIVPERLYPWLNLVSALLVVGVGLAVVRARWLHARAHARAKHHHHHHHHDHGEPGFRGLLGVGISGGIVPCPTALVVLLAAVSLHRVGYGLVLILAFSLGLAAAISAVGLVAVTARRTFARLDLEQGPLRLLPAASAGVIVALGLVMTARALPSLV